MEEPSTIHSSDLRNDQIGDQPIESEISSGTEDKSNSDGSVGGGGGGGNDEVTNDEPEQKEEPEEQPPSPGKAGNEATANATNSMAQRTSPGKTRGGLTMYERSMLQKEERERKLKALQETLMVDFTFTPSRYGSHRHSGESVVSSLGGSPTSTVGGGASTATVGSVFSRLYGTGTAASRAQRHRPREKPHNERFGAGAWMSSASQYSQHSAAGGGRSVSSVQTASPRVESLYKAGEEKLRARPLSDAEEAEQLRKRVETKALEVPGAYTFRPQTKWNLVAERRRLARIEREREEEEEARNTARILQAVS